MSDKLSKTQRKSAVEDLRWTVGEAATRGLMFLFLLKRFSNHDLIIKIILDEFLVHRLINDVNDLVIGLTLIPN